MKKLLILLTCCVLIFVVGCSDDDCPTCNETITPQGLVHGSVYLDPEAYIDYMMVIGYNAIPPNIDSAKLGDSLMYGDDFFDYNYDEEYHENWWEISFDEDGNSSNYMWEHGDTATMTFYGEGMTSTAKFVILDADSAEVTIISPEYLEDTVDAPTNVTITWGKSPDAEYYSIWVEWIVGNDWNDIYHYTYTADTTFTVTADMYPDSVRYFYVDVTPFTGPDPTKDVGNVTGNFLTGKVYSFGWYDYTRIMGWYIPTPTKSSLETVRKVRTEQEMVEKIYELNK